MAAKRRRCLFSGLELKTFVWGVKLVLCMKLLCKSVRGCEIFFLPLVRGNDTATSEYCSRLSDVRLIEHNRDNQFPLDALKLGGLVGESIFATSEIPLLLVPVLDRVGRTSCDASQLERGIK